MRAQGEGNCGRSSVQPWFGLLLRHEATPVMLWVPGSGGAGASPRHKVFDPRLRAKGPRVESRSCHPAPTTQILGSQNSIQTETGLLTNHQPTTSPICGQSDDPARVAFISLALCSPPVFVPAQPTLLRSSAGDAAGARASPPGLPCPPQPGGPSSLSLVPDDPPCLLPAHCTSTHSSVATADLLSYLEKRDFALLPCVSSD